MKDRIQKILELVAAGRLGHDDAAQLLEAISPKLSLSEEARPHVFGLLSAPDFGVQKVAVMLVLNEKVGEGLNFDMGRARGARGTWGGPFGPGRGDFSFNLDDLGQRISSMVESALEGSKAASSPTGKSGRTLRAQGEDGEGNEFTVNVPLSLVDHADKLLPPLAWKLLERQGMTPEALKLLLKSNPPVGVLLEAEDGDGSELQLVIVA